MSNEILVEYNELYIGSITLHGDTVSDKRQYPVHTRVSKHSIAWLGKNHHSYDVGLGYFMNCCSISVPNGSECKLYIHPKCKTARDHFRNSGYKLVKTPEKADYTVLPTLPNTYKLSSFWYTYDIAVLDISTNNLFMYDVSWCNPNYDSVSDAQKNSILSLFPSTQYKVVDGVFRRRMCFLPKGYGYEDMILDTYSDRYYVMEEDVELKSSVDISLDTLMIWDKCSDKDIIAKSICQSNWREYPVTLLYFLKTNDFYYYTGNKDFEVVKQSLNYKLCTDEALNNKLIEPKDWNMLQSYIMAKFGVGENGGYINSSDYFDIPTMLRSVMRARFVIAPINITVPTTYGNILSMYGDK